MASPLHKFIVWTLSLASSVGIPLLGLCYFSVPCTMACLLDSLDYPLCCCFICLSLLALIGVLFTGTVILAQFLLVLFVSLSQEVSVIFGGHQRKLVSVIAIRQLIINLILNLFAYVHPGDLGTSLRRPGKVVLIVPQDKVIFGKDFWSRRPLIWTLEHMFNHKCPLKLLLTILSCLVSFLHHLMVRGCMVQNLQPMAGLLNLVPAWLFLVPVFEVSILLGVCYISVPYALIRLWASSAYVMYCIPLVVLCWPLISSHMVCWLFSWFFLLLCFWHSWCMYYFLSPLNFAFEKWYSLEQMGRYACFCILLV